MFWVSKTAGAAFVAAMLAVVLSGCGGGESAVSVGPQAAASVGAQSAAKAPLRAASNAADPFTVTTLLTWAPTHYPQLFTRSYFVGTSGPYSYRQYPQTATSSNYLGYDSNNDIYYKLGDEPVTKAGALTDFECQVVPSHCPVTAPPANDYEAFSGLYVGDGLTGPSPNGWLLVAADGSFIGTNSTTDGSRFDTFAGNASVQPGAQWSSTAIRYGTYTSRAVYANLGSATATGTFATQGSANATLAISGVPSVSSQLSVAYNAKSLVPASLWAVGGSYVYPPYGTNLTIDTSTGAVSGVANVDYLARPCSVTGTLTIPSPNRNVYKLVGTLTGAGCPVTGEVDFLGFYDSNTYQQALFLYGTTPGSQLAFVSLILYRNS